MRQTQLVRLDKPYNIILGKNGKFALHIATLIVIDDEKRTYNNNVDKEIVTVARCYPVVGNSYELDGQVWMDSEQKDCMQICREGETVSLFVLKRAMEYCSKNNIYMYDKSVPTFFSMALFENKCKLQLPLNERNQTIKDYVVKLEFDEGGNDGVCMVYADKDSNFFFFECFTKDPSNYKFIPTKDEALEALLELRNNYLLLFHPEGLRSITFTTEDKECEWFVDRLNSTATNE